MDGLMLWNRLGSASQVRNSDVGPDGTYLGGGSFGAGRFGAGFQAEYDEDRQVLFPLLGAVLPTAGTVEFWGKIEGVPDGIDWGNRPYFITSQNEPARPSFDINIGFNGNDGLGNGGLVGAISQAGTGSVPYYVDQSYADILPKNTEGWHHYALVWDAAGVEGTPGDRDLALFVDGKLESTNWDGYYSEVDGLKLTGGSFALLESWLSQGTTAIDNLKTWDYAKTDFSDRFVEGFTLVGTAGADTLRGSAVGDDLRGLGGNDALCGLGGADLLRGDAGRDVLSGGAGRDTLKGAAGDDRLYGGLGSDDITDGVGRDALWGGGEADVFRFVKDGQLDRICDFGDGDRIDLTAWGLRYADLHIVDGGPGAVLVTSATDSILVHGAGGRLTPGQLTEDRFIFGDEPDLDWVQWRTEDGGNGHWYALVIDPQPVSWTEANTRAQSLANGNGHLVTLATSSENDFVFERLASDPSAWNEFLGPYIGLYQVAGSAEPDAGWRWVTDEHLQFTNWGARQPDNAYELGSWEDVGHYLGDTLAGDDPIQRTWNDVTPDNNIYAFVVEVDDPLAFF